MEDLRDTVSVLIADICAQLAAGVSFNEVARPGVSSVEELRQRIDATGQGGVEAFEFLRRAVVLSTPWRTDLING